MITFKRSVLIVLMAGMMAGSAQAFETESNRLRGLTYYTEPTTQGSTTASGGGRGRPEGVVGKPVGRSAKPETSDSPADEADKKSAMSGMTTDKDDSDEEKNEKEVYRLMRRAMTVSSHCGALKERKLTEALKSKSMENEGANMTEEAREKMKKELKDKSDRALGKASKLSRCEMRMIDVATSADEAASRGRYCGIMERADELKECMDLVKEEGDEGMDVDTDEEDDDEDNVEKTERIRKILQLRKSMFTRTENVKKMIAKRTHVMEAIKNERDVPDTEKADLKKELEEKTNKGSKQLLKLRGCMKKLERSANSEGGNYEVDYILEAMDYEDCMKALEGEDDDDVTASDGAGTPEGDRNVRTALCMANDAEEVARKAQRNMEAITNLDKDIGNDPDLSDDEKKEMRVDLKKQADKEREKATKMGTCLDDMTEVAMDIAKATRKGQNESLADKGAYKKCKMELEVVLEKPYEPTDTEKPKKNTDSAKRMLKLAEDLDDKIGEKLEKSMSYQEDVDELDDDDDDEQSDKAKELIKKTLERRKEKALDGAKTCMECESGMRELARFLMKREASEDDADQTEVQAQMCGGLLVDDDDEY